ncbi:uncharacterized protein LOC132701004 [Cylas formicarius]|uniref:uncharacterized protein LOC132701004 n=1 Tax=Cylas formicarius TaxID=197179 RepID=UPI00295884F8|nr:uncharacterized protein LOC132701004 [Cylas formicarius]
MDVTENPIEVDPDYECTNQAIRSAELREAEDSKLTEEKLRKIFREEFDKELESRQRQLEEIEEKVFRAQKLLHLIRYVLISSYYHKKSLEYDAFADSTPDNNDIMNGQSRIHPALKKLIGNNAQQLNLITSLGKRKSSASSSVSQTLSELKTEPEQKKIKLEPESNGASNQYCPDVVTSRKKTQHRIVVGNISYYKKSIEQDNMSHKWMVYVKVFKGAKGGAEVHDVIERVVFHLHPSYRPHDVVDINEPPFHLSRRGWGEFPLRVQIFFKSATNKPIDVVHHLKLSKTFTERQTIGNETVVQVFLYDAKTAPTPFDAGVDEEDRKNIDLLPENNQEAFEHNYCYDSGASVKREPPQVDLDVVKEEVDVEDYAEDGHASDHNYSLPYRENDHVTPKKTVSSVNQAPNELVHGLGGGYADLGHRPVAENVVKVLKTASGQSIRFLPESFSQILLNNGRIVQIKLVQPKNGPPIASDDLIKIMLPGDLVKIQPSKVKTCPEYGIWLPEKRFGNMGEALPYAFKRTPLWTRKVSDANYKSVHPFAARSEREFRSWNVGKRLAAEWGRAKAIKRLLSAESYGRRWTTRAVFLYGRSHFFSPVTRSSALLASHTEEGELLLNCFRASKSKKTFVNHDDKPEIISVDTSPVKDEGRLPKNAMELVDTSTKGACAYVKEEALSCGVLLKSEEIAEGVTMNAAERVMLEGVRCLAEGLIRRAGYYLIAAGGYRPGTSTITCKEVTQALEEREEFKSIRKFHREKLTLDFFS